MESKRPRTRKLYGITTLVICMSLVTAGVVLAASTTKSLSTNYTLINLGSAIANVSVGYYTDTGANWAASPSSTGFTIPANGGQAIIAQYFDNAMAPGRGSAVVSSDQPLGGVVQILARNQTPTSGAYVGNSTTDSTYYVPLVLRRLASASGLSNSQIVVQNADSTTVDVTINLVKASASPGANHTKNYVGIPVGSSVYFDLDDEISGNLPDGWYGSAVVTAAGGEQIVVVSNLFAGPDTLQTFNAFAASQLTDDWFVPLFTSRLANGLSTPVTVQNLTGAALAAGDVDMTCTKDAASGGANFTVSNTAAAANNELIVFNPVVDTVNLPDNWFGACRVTAPGDVGVFVQMRKPGFDATAGAYEAIPSAGTNTTMLVPLAARRLANGFATAVTIQNLDTSAATSVNITYIPSPTYGGSQTPVVVNGLAIPAGGSLIRNHRLTTGPAAETALPDGWFGTMVIESTGAAIDGFVQLTNIIPQAGDTLMAHGVFTQP